MAHRGQGHSPVPWAYDKSRLCVFSGSRMATGHRPLCRQHVPADADTSGQGWDLSAEGRLFTTALRGKRRPRLPRSPPDMCTANVGLLFNLNPRGVLLSSQGESCSCTQPGSFLQILLGTLVGGEWALVLSQTLCSTCYVPRHPLTNYSHPAGADSDVDLSNVA